MTCERRTFAHIEISAGKRAGDRQRFLPYGQGSGVSFGLLVRRCLAFETEADRSLNTPWFLVDWSRRRCHEN
jgi:hypothetical protein